MTHIFAGHFTFIFYLIPLGIRKEANPIPVSPFYSILFLRTFGHGETLVLHITYHKLTDTIPL